MARFEQIRHRPAAPLSQPRDLLLVVSPLRSSVNLSRLVRLAGCAGLTQIYYCGSGKIDPTITRDAVQVVTVTVRRTLVPVVQELKKRGYHCAGLEQTTNSQLLFDFQFPRKTALVVGSERDGLSPDVLQLLDSVVEIPVYGQPASYNVVTATTMAVYEYCRQYRDG